MSLSDVERQRDGSLAALDDLKQSIEHQCAMWQQEYEKVRVALDEAHKREQMLLKKNEQLISQFADLVLLPENNLLLNKFKKIEIEIEALLQEAVVFHHIMAKRSQNIK